METDEVIIVDPADEAREIFSNMEDIGGKPVAMFAHGLASFCAKIGLPEKTSESFMLLSVSAFLMTSVDSCTRLARFVWQEIWSTASSKQPSETGGAAPAPSPLVRLNKNMYVATAVVIAIGVYLLLLNPAMVANLWTMFASANQMLAALTLLTATLWLLKNRLNFWVVLLPMFFMLVTSGTAVFNMFLANVDKWMKHGFAAGGVTAISAAALFLLCITLLVLGGFCLRRIIKHRINEAIKRMAKE